MMGRGRNVVTNVAERSYKSEDSDDEQVEIFDVPVSKTFRRQQASQDTKTVPSDTKTNDENMLVCAGFDLEGILEQEKAEIMKAFLASKADQVAQNSGVPSDREVIRSNNTGKSNKDSEKLVTSTIHGRRPLNVRQARETIDSASSPVFDQKYVDRYDREIDGQFSKASKTDTCLRHQKMWANTAASPNVKDKPVTKQGTCSKGFESCTHFPPLCQTSNTESPFSGGSPSYRSQKKYSGDDCSIDNRAFCKCLVKGDKSLETMSSSKESSCKTNGQASTSCSVSGENSGSQSETSVEDIPLKRHYRGAKTLFLHKYNYFQPSNGTNVEDVTKAICQLFELYRIRLQKVQKSCQVKLEWGEPVKSGQHHSKTIDFKKRGQDSICLDLSDDDDFQSIESNKYSKGEVIVNASDQDPAGKQIENYSENELAVDNQSQDGNSWNYVRPLRSRLVKYDTVSPETKKYSFDDACDVKYASSARSQNGLGTQSLRNFVQVKAETNKNASRKILADVDVDETQQDDSSGKEATMSNEDIGPETQEDEEFVSVSKRFGTGTFEHETHQDKTNTCNVSETKQKKYENNEQKKVSSSLKNDTKFLRNYHSDIVDEITLFENESNLKKSKQNLINAVQGKKGKAEKHKVANLTKDSGDLDENNRNVVRNTRLKRKCYTIDSDSEEESAAATEHTGVSFERKLVGSAKDLEKADKNMAELPSCSASNSLSSTDSNMLDFRSSTTGKNACIASSQEHPKSNTKLDKEEGPLSSVIKRKRLYNEEKEKYGVTTEAFDVFKKRENSKNVEAEVSSFLKEDEKAFVTQGVKRLLSSPVSSESIVSDDLSSTSSQVSLEMLDEKGNIYPTQFSAIKSKKGKGKHVQNAKVELKKWDKNMRNKQFEGILMMADSEEDILVEDRDAQNDCVNMGKKSPLFKNSKSNLKYSLRQNLPKFTENTKVIGENETLDIDPKVKELKQKMPMNTKTFPHDKIVLKDDKEILHDDDAYINEQHQLQGKFTETNSKEMRGNSIPAQTASRSLEKTTGANSLHSPIKASTWQQMNMELAHSNKVIYTIDSIDEIECGQKLCNSELSQSTGEEGKTKKMPFENKDNCEGRTKNVAASVPVMPSILNFSVKNTLPNNVSVLHKINTHAENRSGNKHINILDGVDGNLVDRPKTRLQGKVLATATVPAVEQHEREPVIAQQGSDGDDVVPATPEKSPNKRTGKKNGKSDHLMKRKKMTLVTCPICNVDFTEDTIEQHAGYCTGPELNDQYESDTLSSLGQHPDQVKPFPGNYQGDRDSEKIMTCASADMDVDDDEQVTEMFGAICSTSQEAIGRCCFCDQEIVTGKSFEKHVKACMKLAIQKQAEMDGKKLDEPLHGPVEDVSQMRKSRSRSRQTAIDDSKGNAAVRRKKDGGVIEEAPIQDDGSKIL